MRYPLVLPLISSLFVTGVSLNAASAEAEAQRWFDIEVVVFKHKRGNLEEELWPSKNAIQYPENLKDIVTEQLFPTPEGMLSQSAYKALIEQQGQDSQDNNQETNRNKTASSDLSADNNDSALTENEAMLLKPFSVLDEQELKLTDIAESLSRSSYYEPLAHIGWRQPVNDKQQAEWVRIVGGKNYQESFEHSGKSRTEEQTLNKMGLGRKAPQKDIFGNTYDNSTPDVSTSNNATNSNVNNNVYSDTQQSTQQSSSLGVSDDPLFRNHPPVYTPVPEVDGAIQIYLGRYLHINTQMYYRHPGKEELDISALNSTISSSLLNMTEDGVIKQDYQSDFNWSFQTDNWFEQEKQTATVDKLLNYTLQQSRRVRSEETHYFDHPLFGIIIQIRPFEIDDEKSDDLDSNATGR
jgi:hypothetical protein